MESIRGNSDSLMHNKSTLPKGQGTKQAQDAQHDKNYKLTQGQHSQISFDVPDQYAEQIHLRKE